VFKLGKSSRVLAAALLVAGGGLAVTNPTLRVHAATCVTDYSGDELNPIVSQSDVLATVDTGRTYADITGACATEGANNTVAITTTSPIPTAASFPKTNGDIGITYQACSDATGPLGSAIDQIGIGHRGGPVYAGPFPGSQGWKICSYLTIQAATPNDYGMEIFDPVGNFTFFDFPGLSGFTAPAISGSTVTLSLPSTMCAIVNAPAPPLVGIARQDCYRFFNSSTLAHVAVETQVNAEATLPFPVCVNTNPPGISCNGNQTIGPIFGIVGLLATSDWAPGKITCGTPGLITSCAPAGDPTGAFSNALDLGLLPLPPEGQAIETCLNPITPGPGGVPPANTPAVTCGATVATFTYNPCQAGSTATQDQGDLYTVLSAAGQGSACTITSATSVDEYDTEYGRIYPAQLPSVDGFAIGPAFLNDSWNG